MQKIKLLAILYFLFFIAGCAAGSSFHPKTVEGANCKAQCAKDMARCGGSSYSCDRAASTCMDACQDLDNLTKK